MAADQAEIHRDRSRDCVEKGEDGQFGWEEWDWESMVDEVGAAREAFEPRESREFRRQNDGHDEGGNKVLRRQDDEHDEGGKKLSERQGEVVRRQSEDDMQ